MDIWGNIYIGKRWVEEDGGHGCEIQNSKEWHIKTAHKITVADTQEFRRQYATLGAECARIIAMQLMQIREELIKLAKYGIKKEDADEKAGPTKKGPDTGAN